MNEICNKTNGSMLNTDSVISDYSLNDLTGSITSRRSSIKSFNRVHGASSRHLLQSVPEFTHSEIKKHNSSGGSPASRLDQLIRETAGQLEKNPEELVRFLLSGDKPVIASVVPALSEKAFLQVPEFIDTVLDTVIKEEKPDILDIIFSSHPALSGSFNPLGQPCVFTLFSLFSNESPAFEETFNLFLNKFPDSFRDTNLNGENILFEAVKYGDAGFVDMLSEKLPPRFFSELLRQTDNEGNNILHCTTENIYDPKEAAGLVHSLTDKMDPVLKKNLLCRINDSGNLPLDIMLDHEVRVGTMKLRKQLTHPGQIDRYSKKRFLAAIKTFDNKKIRRMATDGKIWRQFIPADKFHLFFHGKRLLLFTGNPPSKFNHFVLRDHQKSVLRDCIQKMDMQKLNTEINKIRSGALHIAERKSKNPQQVYSQLNLGDGRILELVNSDYIENSSIQKLNQKAVLNTDRKYLGSGGFKIIRTGRLNYPDGTTKKVAVAKSRDSARFDSVVQGVKFYETFSHPNIIKGECFASTGKNGSDKAYLILYDIAEGNMFDEPCLEAVQSDPVGAFTQMARGLAEMHRQGYIHGDIKPENFLLVKEGKPSFRIVLTDFDSIRPKDGPLPYEISNALYDSPGKSIPTQRIETAALARSYRQLLDAGNITLPDHIQTRLDRLLNGMLRYEINMSEVVEQLDQIYADKMHPEAA